MFLHQVMNEKRITGCMSGSESYVNQSVYQKKNILNYLSGILKWFEIKAC
jgi:hypothetical protein